jgi:hypothetical protein
MLAAPWVFFTALPGLSYLRLEKGEINIHQQSYSVLKRDLEAGKRAELP